MEGILAELAEVILAEVILEEVILAEVILAEVILAEVIVEALIIVTAKGITKVEPLIIVEVQVLGEHLPWFVAHVSQTGFEHSLWILCAYLMAAHLLQLLLLFSLPALARGVSAF
jgi:hypothetical protein